MLGMGVQFCLLRVRLYEKIGPLTPLILCHNNFSSETGSRVIFRLIVVNRIIHGLEAYLQKRTHLCGSSGLCKNGYMSHDVPIFSRQQLETEPWTRLFVYNN